ncbi:Probable transmembrane protein [Klebsiella pneumoniae subsp. pneumoniae ST512-K30BO]|nr:Probable transmembrane protein [Klebsiella pneumoniae subsp. pneumoniae ST512-K30BO]
MSDEAMLSVIPAGIFSRLRIFLGRLKPHALPVARRHIVLGSIGAGTGLAVTSMFSHWLLGEVNLWFIAPMGASAVLLFGVPSSPLAQPWSIVGGNVLSALIGVTVGMLVPDAALACGSGGGSGHRRDVFSALSASPRRRGGPDGDPRRRRGAQRRLSLCADPGAPQLADAGAAGYCV